ncbi:hypothetical protein MF672_044810 [Actinomadura sp. ATCC 31491]|uniref:Uncharacterized protein n=1 Tax=Actinomadura luzonensis TaxID=2805427 RepID=A0ABT0G8H7_9ACTN|nr:hypothetical protein [Actinomadura luzonensis]MCK2220882.1 hypothetical protein [Actinomadura luzonensis]
MVAGIPLLRPGAAPPYTVPPHVAAAGMPRGATRRQATAAGPCEERWAEVAARVCGTCFGPAERARGVLVIGHAPADPAERFLSEHLEELIARYPGRVAFGGCLRAAYPWRAGTRPVEGEARERYSVGHEIRLVPAADGWAAGGWIEVTVPGHGPYCGAFTHALGDTVAWPESEIAHSHLPVGPGRRGRVDVHEIGGRYDGVLCLSMTGFPRHAGDPGTRCFDLAGSHVRTGAGLLCFPLREAFVKAPGAPMAVLRLHRTWPGGDPEPDHILPSEM